MNFIILFVLNHFLLNLFIIFFCIRHIRRLWNTIRLDNNFMLLFSFLKGLFFLSRLLGTRWCNNAIIFYYFWARWILRNITSLRFTFTLQLLHLLFVMLRLFLWLFRLLPFELDWYLSSRDNGVNSMLNGHRIHMLWLIRKICVDHSWFFLDDAIEEGFLHAWNTGLDFCLLQSHQLLSLRW